uniref:COP9 signalosome complex subunit 3 n=1 Tax=Strongyloides stercoralis TaxID=6248 RepID=A0A0K0EBR0_STRER
MATAVPSNYANIKEKGDLDFSNYIAKLQDYCNTVVIEMSEDTIINCINESDTRSNNIFLWHILSTFFKNCYDNRPIKSFIDFSIIMKLVYDTDPSEGRQIFDVIEFVGRDLVTRLTASNDSEMAKDLCKGMINLLQNGNSKVITSFHSSIVKIFAKEEDVTGALEYIILDDYQLLNERLMTKVKKISSVINPCSLVSYFYYSGNVMMKVGRYADAFVCYESVIHITNKVSPPNSNIFSSSIKRYILSGILAFQRSPLVNFILTNETIRNFNFYFSDYVTIHKYFKNGLIIDNITFSKFSTIIDRLHKKADNETTENCEYLMLIKELVIKHSVIKFAKAYSRMTVDDLKRKSFLPPEINIGKYLHDLVNQKLINVCVGDGKVITFIDNEEIDTSSVYKLCGEVEVAQRRLHNLKSLLLNNFSNEKCFVDEKFDTDSLEVIACTDD